MNIEEVIQRCEREHAAIAAETEELTDTLREMDKVPNGSATFGLGNALFGHFKMDHMAYSDVDARKYAKQLREIADRLDAFADSQSARVEHVRQRKEVYARRTSLVDRLRALDTTLETLRDLR